MKRKHVFISFGLALVAAFGMAFGLNAKSETKAVKADAPTSPVTMYVDFSNVSGWWFSDGASTKIHAFADGLDAVDLDVTLIENQLYKFTLGTGYTTFIVARLNSAGTEWWNQSHDVNYSSSFNLVTLKDSKTDNKNEYSVSTLVKFSEDYLVVDAYQSSSYWASDSAHIYVCFYYGDAAWSFFEFTAPYLSTKLYSIKISSTYADRFVVVRGTADFAGFVEGWEDEVWNKTTDIKFTSENKECRYVKLGTSIPESKDVNVAGFETISVASFVDSYSYQFLQLGLCLDAGGLDENFDANFDAAEDLFDDMKAFATNLFTLDLKAALKLVDNTEDSNAGHAMKRYDTIMAKHSDIASTSNFIDRGIDQSLASGRISVNDIMGNGNLSIMLIMFASISALAATLFFVFKKKRHN